VSDYASIFKPDLFENRRVLITGGGSGIGRCVAHELASLGAAVAIVGRKVEKLEAVVGEIADDGGQADYRSFDIRDEAAVDEGIASLIESGGNFDGLVNNAGGQFPSPASQISQRGFETVLRTNLVGGFLVARALFNHQMSRTGGAIVNLLADMWRGMPGMAHSGAARAGMLNLTHTTAVEWAPQGVRVNAVAPGWIASSGLDTYDNPMVRAMIPELPKHVPLKRLGSESEVSAAIVFLLSDAAAFITGTCLQVDGGAPLAPRIWPMPDHDRSTAFEAFHRGRPPRVLDPSAENDPEPLPPKDRETN
jgi:citronellol/citronellal dehydrogenase